jgi:DNA-3-methyladenine glycosylase II
MTNKITTIQITPREPFSFEQTLTFIRRFPGCQTQALAGPDSVTAAFSAGGRGYAVTLRPGVLVELPAGAPRSLAARAAEWIGADDDVSSLYARARTDGPFQPLLRALHGLHHVRFLGLEDAAVHAVLMQRQSPAQTARMKRRFLEELGHAVGAGPLRAMPALDELAGLSAARIEAAINHRAKAERIASVVRGVAAIGEDFLRAAPYAAARARLVAIDGVGPFSATAILLRGLGRHDENPVLDMFEDDARLVYGDAWDAGAIVRRYGDQIGYWTYYLKTGAARM